MTKLVVFCGFSGVLIPGHRPSEPERAAAELRRAGYVASRIPEVQYDAWHPGDATLEAIIEGQDDPKIIEAVRHEVEAIIIKYGGEVSEWGVL
jgi:hypothetical protein